jgi:hypothetical protein
MKKMSGFAVLIVCLFAASSTVLAQAPTLSVKITSPAPGTYFEKCSDITITADPQIEGGEIKNVRFYPNPGANVIGSRSSAPYEFTWKGVVPGYYVLTARLTAKTGETVNSDPVPITVGNAVKGNILVNGEFDCKTLPWLLGLSTADGASATWAIDPTAEIATGAAAMVNIVTGGTANWHVQLYQPLPVDSGHTYIFSFTAQSMESSKAIDVAIQMNHDPWAVYYQMSPTIESLQDYGPYVWESTITDHSANIIFNIGLTDNTTFWLDNVKVIDESLTGLRDRKPPNANGFPSKQLISRNYPNPFNPGTTIQYRLPEDADVTLTLYNLRGQAVRTLVQENQKPGEHLRAWNGENESGERVPSGVYVYRLKARASDRTYAVSRKIMLLE